MVNILLIQDTDWVVRGPHQQHHIFERLNPNKYSIWVVDFEILWNKQKVEGIFQGQKTLHNIIHIKENKIEIIRPPMLKIPLLDKLTIPFFHTRTINRIIKHNKITVIVGQTILNTICGLFLSKLHNIPFIYHIMDSIHSIASDYIPKYFLFIAEILERLIVKFSNSIVTVNKGLKDYVIRLGGNPEKVKIISEGVDYKKYQIAKEARKRIRQQLGIKEDDLVLFFMGWLYPFSGLRELADQILKRSSPEIKLVVVGDGELYPYLLSLSEQSHQIIVTGRVPFKEIPFYLSAADICVLPAYQNKIMRDIVPIKVIEYMAAGKPVISTKLRGIQREFGQNNGIIYCNDAANLIQEALKLRNNGEINAIGRKGANFVKSRDWEVVVKRFEDVIWETIRNFR
ncbi:MAG: glycosyltransferase family 4 protein [Candidatus Helarchaeota archaeon]